jgi:hypothetical protein
MEGTTYSEKAGRANSWLSAPNPKEEAIAETCVNPESTKIIDE